MINLEWLRTFRAVYRTKSLSRAAEILNISQPTVSQHIQALESHVNQKLFTRKSKGVQETDDGKILNTLVSGSIESLEEAENIIHQRYRDPKTIITIGISSHLYKAMLCHQILELGEYVHVKFGSKKSLITDVEEGRLLYAIVSDGVDTFDMISHPLGRQALWLVHTPDIDLGPVRKLYRDDPDQLEANMLAHPWYAHDAAAGFIKLLWLHRFDHKRPSVVPNYIIPNEHECLVQLVSGTGLSVALDSVAEYFVRRGELVRADLEAVDFRNITLLSNKKKAPKDLTDRILEMMKRPEAATLPS